MRHDPSEFPLPIEQRPFSQVFSVQPQQIEGIKVRITSLEHEVVELRVTILSQTHDLAIEDRVLYLEVHHNRLA